MSFPNLEVILGLFKIYDAILKDNEKKLMNKLGTIISSATGNNNPEITNKEKEDLIEQIIRASKNETGWAEVIMTLGRKAHDVAMNSLLNYSHFAQVLHLIRNYILTQVEWSLNPEKTEVKVPEKQRLDALKIKTEIDQEIKFINESLIDPQPIYISNMKKMKYPPQRIQQVSNAYSDANDDYERDLIYLAYPHLLSKSYFRKALFPENYIRARYEYDPTLIDSFIPIVLQKNYWVLFIKKYAYLDCLKTELGNLRDDEMTLMGRLEGACIKEYMKDKLPSGTPPSSLPQSSTPILKQSFSRGSSPFFDKKEDTSKKSPEETEVTPTKTELTSKRFSPTPT